MILTCWFCVVYQFNYIISLQSLQKWVHGVDEGHHLFSSLVSIIQTWWLGTTILTHSDSEYATQADWVTKSNTSLRRFKHSRCDWLNHTTWFHSNPALPDSMEFESILFHFWKKIQTPICYVGCLMIAKAWTYISLYTRNTAILENKKSVCNFPYQLENTCDLHLFRLLKCAICRTIPIKMPPIGQLSAILNVY